MGKFLIEVPHEEEVLACARVVEIFLKTGSHFVTNADWGCRDGEHKAWILIEVDNKEEARRILPPAFRSKAKIVSLNQFSMEEIDPVFIHHAEFEIGGQTARPVHGGQHPVSTSALRNARSRNEFNAYSHPVGPTLSAGSGRGFGVCFGSVLLLSSL